MDQLNWTLAIDAVMAVIILWMLLKGRADGVVKKLGSLAAVVAALLLGKAAKAQYAPLVAERWISPAMQGILNHARESLGLSDLLENLAEILNKASLPGFLKIHVPEDVAGMGNSYLDSAVSSASGVVGERLSGWLLFTVTAILAYALVRILFNGVIDPVISNLPVIGKINHFAGLVLGAILGAVLSVFLLWLTYHLVPALSQPGAPLSPEAVEKSFLTRFCFQTFPGLFGGR